MSWQKETRDNIVKGRIYSFPSLGKVMKVKALGSVSQFGGHNSGGAIWAKVEIIEADNEVYPVGSVHDLNAEFMH